MLGVAFGAGFILGPAIGGLAGSIDPRLPFWVAAGFGLANVLYGWLDPAGVAAERTRMAFSWRRANPLGALKLLRSHRELTRARERRTSSACSRTRCCRSSRCSTQLQIRLGRARGRLPARGRRRLLDGGAGRADRAVDQAVRRAQGADRRARVRRRGVFRLRGSRRPARCSRSGIPLQALWGIANPASHRADEPPRRRRRAGPAPGREREHLRRSPA